MRGAIAPLLCIPLWHWARFLKAQGQLYFHVNLYATPDIVRVIKSRRMRWNGHEARMGEMRNACNILAG
jgi:hypothetical protein